MDSTCSSCGAAVSGGDVMYTAAAALVCPACFDKADLAVTTDRSLGTTSLATAGLVVGAIPLFLSIRVSEHGSTRDWVAVICGVIALAIGGVATAGAVKGKGTALGLGLLVLALGAYQVARGFGAL